MKADLVPDALPSTHIKTNHFFSKNRARETQHPQKRNSPLLQGWRIRTPAWWGFWWQGRVGFIH